MAIAVALANAGCKKAPTVDPISPAERTPPLQAASEEPPARIVEIDGWRILKWGDSIEAVKGKLKDVGLSRCSRGLNEKAKGRIRQCHSCYPSNKEAMGLRYVLLFYLDGRLERVVPTYRMTAGSAAVDNLEKALADRYCPLIGSLAGALTQLKLGNVGQDQEIKFGCAMSNGEAFLTIESKEEMGEDAYGRVVERSFFSEVSVFLSSDSYQAFLNQNEFSGSF